MEKVKLLLVGLGGYAATYLNPLLDGKFPDAEIVGCADPYPESCKRIAEVRALGVPLLGDMDEFFAAGGKADLCVIVTPIHLHARQMKSALAHGCNVLCEKPLVGDVADIPSVIAAREAAGKYVGIGYQWSHARAIQAFKADIMKGVWGAPQTLKSLVLWPRDYAYYGRGSGWAGKLRAKDGSLILDSVANNATAHYLHNMLYVLGGAVDTAAMPETVEAQLFRANDIENYDSCAMRLTLAGGVKILFYASHATRETVNPVFEYRFENGVVRYEQNGPGAQIVGVMKDGRTFVYGDPFDSQTRKLRLALDAVKDPKQTPLCGIEAATPHAMVIAQAQKSGVTDFPAADVIEYENDKGGKGRYVKGLYERYLQAYRTETLL